MSTDSREVCRILLVEDDDLVRDFLVAKLRRALPGARVVAANEGRAALLAYGRERPDLIITDLNLGEISGAQVIAEIRRTDQETPILVITGAPDVARVPGANEVVPKIRFAYLIDRVVEVLAARAGVAVGTSLRADDRACGLF